ncbi:protein kinase [Candidatus Dependentiae bacterium]|nr:protein kinase [Candidatus Dependentiae bacterium]
MDENRYEKIREIDSGGQGDVSLVFDKQLDRNLALKKLKKGASEAAIKQFKTEALINAKLEHPSIPPIHELATNIEDNNIYFTMRYIEGKTLAEKIAEANNLNERLRLLGNFIDICNAVAFAHSKGILHLDIKPDNIKLGKYGESILLDWGIGKFEDENFTLHGYTAKFTSPEAARHKSNEIDKRSDIYSLGSVLYSILTGKVPFDSGTSSGDLFLVINQEPKTIKEIEPAMPIELIGICNKAMKKNKAERFQHAKEMAEALSDFISGKIVKDIYIPWYKKIYKTFQMHKFSITINTLIILIITAFVLFSVSQRKEMLANISRSRTLNLYGAKAEFEKSFNLAYFYYANSFLKTPGMKLTPFSRAKMASLYLSIVPLESSKNINNSSLIRVLLSPDSSKFLINTVNDNILLVDSKSYKVLQIFKGIDCDLSSDGKTLAYISKDNAIILINVESGELVKNCSLNSGKPVIIKFNNEGNYLIIGFASGRIKLWNLKEDEPIITLEGHSTAISALNFMKSDEILISGSKSGMMKIWNIARINEIGYKALTSPNLIQTYIVKPGDTLKSIAFKFFKDSSNWILLLKQNPKITNPDLIKPGTKLKILFQDNNNLIFFDQQIGNLKIRNISNKYNRVLFKKIFNEENELINIQMYPAKNIQAHSSKLTCISINETSNLIATSGRDSTIKIWNLHDYSLIKIIKAHKGWVSSVKFSPKGNFLLSSGFDNKLKIWDTSDFQLHVQIQGHFDAITSAIFSNDGNKIISTSSDKSIKTWRFENRSKSLTLDKHLGTILSIAFNPTGDILASCATDEIINIWSVKDRIIKKSLIEQYNKINDILFLPDRKRLVSAGNESIIIWDIDNGKKIQNLYGHEGSINTIAIDPERNLLISGGADNNIFIWDINTWKRIKNFNAHDTNIITVAASSKVNYFISGDENGIIKIWNTNTFQNIKTLITESGSVNSLVIDTVNSILVSGHKNSDILIWNTKTWELISKLKGHSSSVSHLKLINNSKYLISSGTRTGIIIIWDMNTFKQVSYFQNKEGWIFSFDIDHNSEIISVAYNNRIFFYSLTNLILSDNAIENDLKNKLDLFLLNISDSAFNTQGIKLFHSKSEHYKIALKFSRFLILTLTQKEQSVKIKKNFMKFILLIIFYIVFLIISFYLKKYLASKSGLIKIYSPLEIILGVLFITLPIFIFIQPLKIEPGTQNIISNLSKYSLTKYFTLNIQFFMILFIVSIITAIIIYIVKPKINFNLIPGFIPGLIGILSISIFIHNYTKPFFKERGFNIVLVEPFIIGFLILLIIVANVMVYVLIKKDKITKQKAALKNLFPSLISITFSFFTLIYLTAFFIIRFFFYLELYQFQI